MIPLSRMSFITRVRGIFSKLLPNNWLPLSGDCVYLVVVVLFNEMNIVCTICSDLVNQPEDLHVTPCGHLFHLKCLFQWIVRKKTCPHCRNNLTVKGLIRIYPTVSSDQTLDDATTLQYRLDDAQLQLRQHTRSNNELQDKLKDANDRLHQTMEMLKVNEQKLGTRESAVKALRDQLDYAKIQIMETNKLREDNELLKKNMQTLTAALCESEAEKSESRTKLQEARCQLADEKSNVVLLHDKLAHARVGAASLAGKLSNCERKRRDCVGKLRDCESKLREHQLKLWQLTRKQPRDSAGIRDTGGNQDDILRDELLSDFNQLRDSELREPAETRQEDQREDMETNFIVDQSDIQAAVIARLDTGPRGLKRSLSASECAAAAVLDDAPAPLLPSSTAAAAKDSPYLRLSRGGLALAAVNQHRGGELAIKPTEFKSVNSSNPNKISKLGSKNQPSQAKQK